METKCLEFVPLSCIAHKTAVASIQAAEGAAASPHELALKLLRWASNAIGSVQG